MYPLVSVIIPAFNSAATIRRALNSVFAQTRSDFEVIVIDDGSTDDLAAALEPFSGRLTLITQKNAGAAAARNTGVRAATGTWLAFLDADDFWHARKLEIQTPVCSDSDGPVLCYCSFARWHDGMPDPRFDPVQPSTVEVPFRDVFLFPYLGTPGVMLRRSFFNELGGFREDLASAEDVDLWMRAAYQARVVRVSGPLLFVVHTRGSLTSRHGEGTYRDNLQVINAFCAGHAEFLQGEGKTLAARARAKVYEDWGSGALAHRQHTKARELLGKSLRNRFSARTLYLFVKALLLR